MFTKVEQLNEQLLDFPYVNGYSPSNLDAEQLANLPAKHENYVAIRRWIKHMSTFPAGSLPKLKTSPKDDEDDDDIDLFGSGDDEEADKAKAERAKQLEAQKSKGKPGVVAKSSIVLDVKVWDDETDLKEVEAQVRKITNDGLLWGAAKTVPLAFGVCKLQIVCVVEDAKVSVDWLTDQIEELELVQSTDIAAFQKI